MKNLKACLSALLALAISATMFTGCGKEEEVVEVVTEATTTVTYPPLSEVIASTTQPSLDGEEPITEEAACEIALKGYNALTSNSIRELVKYTNIDLYYFIAEGKWASDEELIALWDNAEDTEVDANMFGIMTNIKYLNAERMSTDEIEEYNDFVAFLNTMSSETGEGFTIDYEITDAYIVNIILDDEAKMTETVTDEDGNVTTNEVDPVITNEDEPHFVVVKGNGKWRLDICICFVKELFSMFTSIDSDDYEVIVDGSMKTPEEVTTVSETVGTTEAGTEPNSEANTENENTEATEGETSYAPEVLYSPTDEEPPAETSALVPQETQPEGESVAEETAVPQEAVTSEAVPSET